MTFRRRDLGTFESLIHSFLASTICFMLEKVDAQGIQNHVQKVELVYVF